MNRDLIPLVADIVSAHVSRNFVSPQGVSEVIKSVYTALSSVTGDHALTAANSEGATESIAGSPGHHPAVPVGKSVFPDYIICLEDGKPMKMLKRYLKTSYSMTPKEYRARWGLPNSYPMVAPNYAERRAELARENGLGRKPGHTVRVTRVNEGVSGKKMKRKRAAA
jgi:predicted transcriptional regulator